MDCSDDSCIQEADLEKYRKNYEADEHWQLRKTFLQSHLGKFSEAELLCYAQVFVNVEFLGCRYPAETMIRVAELAQEVPAIKKFRDGRRNKLKRTFVGAQDAVQAKLQKTTATRRLEIEQEEIVSYPTVPSIQLSANQKSANLRNLLRDVIYFDMSETDQNAGLNKTIATMQSLGKLEMKFDDNKFFYVFNGQIVGEGSGTNRKVAKKQADDDLTKKIKANCYTIKTKLQYFTAENIIEPNFKQNGAGASNKASDELQDNNLGFKMLKMLGWKGGSLGTTGEGIVDPIKCEIKIGRGGLGAEKTFDRNHIKNLIKNFKDNHVDYDLVFSKDFTKEERAIIHGIAQSFDLRTKSYGKNNDRHIVISAKLSPQVLRQKLLEGDAYLLEKYEILPPSGL